MRGVIGKTTLRVSQTPMTSTEFMDWAPRGAYTTARLIKGTDRVFELRRHVDRLVTSCKPFMKGSVDDRDIQRLALSAMSEAIDGSKSILEQDDGKLTVLLHIGEEGEKDVEAFAHIEPMKRKDRTAPVYVALGGPPRHNARVKDSKWVHDRKSIVDVNAEETLLLTEDSSSILEGSQTNFFAVLESGAVATAADGILEGTVRAVVIDACKSLNIPLLFEAPKVNEIETFKEAFLASTSRLVLPIDLIGAHTLPKERPVSVKISDWVRQHVEQRSASVNEMYSKLSLHDA